eukprot:CAMPEP_0203635230 /NCGR_PEP_ID=MMETSP0088-20131115/2050_1 /ASSEMBLY_ACC=CAM_ASM_001087 /TAXON_ID=426623 /ORGANISM="Chaetoceros affinis, Strain CCMP159" /LENGTH=133 /DNA_ID=CAMNT_0050489047 /DNA_START=115 /DNA_END=516 /DNA_ORIENTATION=+
MKIAVASLFVASMAVASAFAPGNNFVRPATSLNMAEPAEFVKAEIAANDVVVFSKSFCPFCRKTKAKLEELKIDATVYELNQMDDGADIQAALLELTGQKTVPNVFIKGEHLGGNDDTQAAASSGKLQEMLGM